MKNSNETKIRDLRQCPIDESRARRLCRMTAKQAAKIRDMPRDELARQIYVLPEEFAYLSGRTLKSVQHLMDRNQIFVHREGMPGSKRPKRFIMLQEYWEALRHCRAIITADERHQIDRLMRDKPTYRRSSPRKNKSSVRKLQDGEV